MASRLGVRVLVRVSMVGVLEGDLQYVRFAISLRGGMYIGASLQVVGSQALFRHRARCALRLLMRQCQWLERGVLKVDPPPTLLGRFTV